jgi:hypothetical protein
MNPHNIGRCSPEQRGLGAGVQKSWGTRRPSTDQAGLVVGEVADAGIGVTVPTMASAAPIIATGNGAFRLIIGNSSLNSRAGCLVEYGCDRS